VSRWGKGDPRGSIPPLVERLHSARTTDLLVFRLEIKRHLVQIIRGNYFRVNVPFRSAGGLSLFLFMQTASR